VPTQRRSTARDPAAIALVSFRTPGGVPAEDRVLAKALRRVGWSVAHPIWNDPAVDWSSYRIAIVRSTWDYHRQRPAYLRWVRSTARRVELWNRPEVLRWNTDKRYLRDLARAGVPVVPTLWSPPGRPLDLAEAMDEHGWEMVVVKPAVSAAGDRTFRVGRAEADAGQRALARICRTGTGIVQPFWSSVESTGERSFVFLDGRFSHSVRRVPLFPRHARRRRERLAPASRAMRSVATQALSACPKDLLYARVDLIADAEGDWRVLEVELTEPSLFFVPYPKGAGTMAAAIVRRLAR
jgi:glutathione synthase/RimK-type ligase-like ATP-grasp enzyme